MFMSIHFGKPLLRNPADAAAGVLEVNVVAVHVLYVIEVVFVVVIEIVFIIFLDVAIFDAIDEHLDKNGAIDMVPPKLVEEVFVSFLKNLKKTGFWNVFFWVCWLLVFREIVCDKGFDGFNLLVGKIYLHFYFIVVIGHKDFYLKLVLHVVSF